MKQIQMLISLHVVFSCLISAFYSQSQNIPADDVTYQDLKDLGASCHPKDTCSNVSIQAYDSSDRNCDCDALCIEYDTCCVDSPYRKRNASLKSGVKKNQACVSVHGNSASFFMVSECLPEWTGNPEIFNKCHEHDTRDPHTLLPASDLEKNVTYKNVFCATCNDIEPRRLAVWKMEAYMTLQRNYSVGNLTYDEGSKFWGHWETFNGSRSFSPIEITVIIPKERLPRSCTSGLIRDCDHTWTDRNISQKCHSYMAPIYATKNLMTGRYRNVHCAICNFAGWTDQRDICTLRRAVDAARDRDDQYESRIDDKEKKKIRMAFPLLIDVNTKDGPKVGMKTVKTVKTVTCGDGEQYDSFYKKCRKVVCATPGTVPVNGKCNDFFLRRRPMPSKHKISSI